MRRRGFDKNLALSAIQKIHAMPSIFSIQHIWDVLAAEGFFNSNPWQERINFPGTWGDQNWSLVLPLSLEKMLYLELNTELMRINKLADRIP